MTELSDLMGEANRTREWSTRDIAKKAREAGFSLSHGTVGKILNGTHGRIDPQTVLALESVFNVHRDRIADAAGLPRIQGVYEGPRESTMLSDRQRSALDELIRAIVNEGGMAHGNAAPTTRPKPPTPIRPRTERERAIDAGAEEQRTAARKRLKPALKPSAEQADNG